MGSPSGAGAKTVAPVDGSDRKFFVKAAEKTGNERILKDFDAALDAQRTQTPPSPDTTRPPALTSPPSHHVQPKVAADPSDQKFYNMAADRQNTIVDLEQKAASLQQDIDALGTSGGYVTDALRGDLRDVQAELGRLQGSDDEPPADPSISAGERLARQYAPVLVLPDGDYDLPGDPQDFIDNSRWRQDVPLEVGFSWRGGLSIDYEDNQLGDNTSDNADDHFTAAQIGAEGRDDHFLDLNDDVRGKLGSEDAPFFYQVDDPDQPTKLTYWFFYPYNDGPSAQNHEGDFERITLELDPETGRPIDAIYSAHGNKHTEPVPFSNLDFYRDPETGERTDKPLVYVASGSHASYTVPGSHLSDAPGVLGRVFDDHTVDGLNDAAYVIDTGVNLSDVQQEAWYPENGKGVRWGQIGESGHTSGPHGPSEDKDHVILDE